MDADAARNGQSLPALERVQRALRDEIARLAPGARLPSQHALVKRLGVSRATVQKALDELRAAGLVVSTQGSGSFVAEPRRPPGAPEAPQPALQVLPELLRAALREPHVAIDYYGLTAETLNLTLSPLLVDMQISGRGPQSIAVRLLLPSTDAHLAVPRCVADPADPRPLERLRGIVRMHASTLENSLRALENLGIVPSVSFEVRTLPVTPLHKLYLVNGHAGLHGLYKVVRVPVDLADDRGGSENVPIYDVLGITAELETASPGYLATAREWFDSLWSTVAEDSTLTQ